MAATKNIFCTYYDEDGCCCPYSITEEAQAEDEEGIERETAEENDLEDDTKYIMFKENISLTVKLPTTQTYLGVIERNSQAVWLLCSAETTRQSNQLTYNTTNYTKKMMTGWNKHYAETTLNVTSCHSFN